MKHFLANLISFLPFMLAFVAIMLAIGSPYLQYLSLGTIIASLLLYGPCQWFAAHLWGRP